MRSPNLVRLDQRGPRGTYVLYFDGASNSGWEILPDLRGLDPFKTTGTAIALSGGELQFARGYLSGVKRGEVTTEDIRVNVGLRLPDLVAKPADFAPDIPNR